MDKKLLIDLQRVPKHVAIIMDGNGRWAKSKGMSRVFGHRNALTAVRESVETAGKIGIQAITLYTFSTENWKRPKLEVDEELHRGGFYFSDTFFRYWRSPYDKADSDHSKTALIQTGYSLTEAESHLPSFPVSPQVLSNRPL